jgi:hypothetical protein
LNIRSSSFGVLSFLPLIQPSIKIKTPVKIINKQYIKSEYEPAGFGLAKFFIEYRFDLNIYISAPKLHRFILLAIGLWLSLNIHLFYMPCFTIPRFIKKEETGGSPPTSRIKNYIGINRTLL